MGAGSQIDSRPRPSESIPAGGIDKTGRPEFGGGPVDRDILAIFEGVRSPPQPPLDPSAEKDREKP